MNVFLRSIQATVLLVGLSTVSSAQIAVTDAPGTVQVNDTTPTDSTKAAVQEGKSLEQVNIIAGQTTLSEEVINVDFQKSPARSSQHLLRSVPGLFVAQHAGGGKAEQIFLRGFDVDHGTDVAISVDGMPINQVSHAHGQGYTDLHFLLPELIDKISFNKGPYNPRVGNFATAGSVRFQLKEQIDNNQLSVGYGMFNSKELFGAFKLLETKNHNVYLAGGYNGSDGYFDATQNFNRYNAHLAYNGRIGRRTKLQFTGTTFRSQWDASGQIPIRAVQQDQISRFGAIDNTEGGNTGRSSANLALTHFISPTASVKANVYQVIADFELYSNFTFFLRDPVNGDQIRQKENRSTTGFNAAYLKKITTKKWKFDWETGVGIRYDEVKDLELSYTKNRSETLENVQLGDVYETNYFAFTNLKSSIGKWTLDAGVRGEMIDHRYNNQLDDENAAQGIVLPAILPSASAYYNINKKIQLFAKWGVGFHSNDSRFVIDQTVKDNLPLAFSNDLGFEWKPTSKLVVNLALWRMVSEQEFVYVGDEGVVEASGASERKGVDLFIAYQPHRSVMFNTSINYSHARSLDADQSYIPLAAPLTSTASAHFSFKYGLTASWRARFMGDRPADEQNTVVAEGYFINDVVLGWNRWAV